MGRRVSRRARIGPRLVGAPSSLSCRWTVDEGGGSEATSGRSASSVRLPCVLAEAQEDEAPAMRPDPAAGRRHASPATSPMMGRRRRRRRKGRGRIRPSRVVALHPRTWRRWPQRLEPASPRSHRCEFRRPPINPSRSCRSVTPVAYGDRRRRERQADLGSGERSQGLFDFH
jgi:hypothetical protein